MKRLPLSRGAYAIVDDVDYARVSRHKWTLDKNGYAVRNLKGNGRQRKIMLHRFIMRPPKGMDVDHADGDPLNNTRGNLRVCTRTQNCMNRGPKPDSSSQFKGVTWHKNNYVWQAQMRLSGKTIHLGNYQDEIEAAEAYDDFAYAHYGEFAYLNFPERYE